MKHTYHYLLLSCLLFMTSSLFAQQISVKGQVTDESGEAIPGATISIQGTTTGTISDMDGNFTINAKKGSTLVASFVGYQTATQKVSDTFMKVILKENAVQVDEVVVTALGIKKEKKALAYSVTEVKGDDMNRVKTANLANGLVGKVAGVNVVKPSSGVMGSSRITIRGNGSLNGGNQPLYIIDGVPMDNSGYGQAGMWGGNDGGDGISSINSEDIESMSVLKGGTAAALYGSRAANGAIVITTKKGVAGKPKVEYSLSYTNDSPITKNSDYQWEYGSGMSGMNPDQLAYNAILQNLISNGIPESMIPQYMEKMSSQLASASAGYAQNLGMLSYGSRLDGSDVTQFDGIKRPYAANKNNFKNFYDNAWSLTNNISISGGSNTTQFRISLGDQRYHDLFPSSKMERNNITLNLNSQLTDRFSIKANVMYVRERSKNRPNLGDIIMNGNTYLWIAPANIDIRSLSPAVDEKGNELLPTASGWISNPYFIAQKRSQSDSKDRIIGSLQAQYNFTPNWYLRGRFGGDMINRRAEDVVPMGSGYDVNGSISNSATYNGEFNAEAIAGYTNSWKENLFSLDAFIGWNTMGTWWDSTSSSGSRFVKPDFNSINNTKTKSGGKSFSESYINSIFGQAEFSYKSMLYLTLSGRNDWFSALSYKGKSTPNHIFYPSVGLGFILSEVINMPSWLSYLKLRGSWAESGGSVGPYQLGLTYGYDQSFNGYPIGSINPSTIPNLNLKPLTSISYEGGFEARFLNNRLGIDFTYYVRNTKNDIVSAGISAASGYDNVKINAGKVNNHGVEILFTATPVQSRNFTWNSSFNFSYNKSEIKHITDGITSFILETSRTGYQGGDGAPGYIYHEVGQPYGIIKGYSYKKDENGEIIYKNGIPVRGELTKLGESVHPYTMGFSNSFTCHNFTLSFLIDAKFGGSILSGTNNNVYSFGRHIKTLPGREGGVIGKGVKENGTPNDVKVDPMTYYMAVGNSITEEFVYDASFIKLRELSIGYNFPKTIINKIGLSDLSVSVVGRNLWNIYDKVPLVDPESSFNNGNAQGLEMYGLPATRSIGFNLNVKF